MDLKDVILKQKEVIRARTRQVVNLIRPEMMDWRPEREALSIGEMLRHLWVSEQGVRRVALEADFTYYDARIPNGLRAVLGTLQGLQDEQASLERVHNETLAAIRAFPSEQLEAERIHEAFGFRRKAYVVLMGINEHEVHHRAQLMTYLRMLGTPVPEGFSRTTGWKDQAAPR